MKNAKNNKGITLMALVITIIILIILASIGTYSGIQVVKSAQFTAFSTELKIMQTQVNKLYEEKKNGNAEYIDSLGTAIESSDATVKSHATEAFKALGITDTSDYKYFDTDTIKSLNIEGVEGEFFVNIDKRSVVSYDGFEYEGKTYYTLEQLPDGLYNVEHNTSEQQPDFDVDYELLENGKCKISVNNINYNGNINKWKVKYKKENEEDWKQSNNYSFIIDELGNYRVKIANNNTESNEKQILAKGLPGEYQQVEYIESTGTQYILTENTYNINFEINCDFQLTELQNTYQTVMGQDTCDVRIDSNGYLRGITTLPYIGLTRHICKIIASSTENQRSIVLDGVSYSYTHTYTNSGKCAIFTNGSNINNRKSKAKFYSGNIYLNNELKANFIPCYRRSDNKPGLYDLVNNEFYTNQGTGDFEKGNDIDSGKRIEQIIINDV